MKRVFENIGFVVIATFLLLPAAPQGIAAAEDTPIERARQSMELGQQAFSQGSFQEAAAHFISAYSASSFSAFLYNAGLAHEKAGDTEEMPTRFQALGDAARCFAEAGEVERALAIFERIETEAPEASLPPHTKARLLELRAASRLAVEAPDG